MNRQMHFVGSLLLIEFCFCVQQPAQAELRLSGIFGDHMVLHARDANWLPGRLFCSRLATITRFAVRGVIWYQGESNCGDGEDPRDYQHKMRALINGWRNAFGNTNLPFCFVQLPFCSDPTLLKYAPQLPSD